MDVLEYGMLLIGGCGIGIDRLIMFLIEISLIRDVLLFLIFKRVNKK